MSIDRLDVGELVDGYAIGKAHNLAEWAHRKEQREFAALCHRLRIRRRVLAIRAEGGARLADLRAKQLAWEHEHRDREQQKTEARERRRKKHDAARPIVTCRECGATWPKPFRKGRVRRFCDGRCYNRFRYRKARDAGRRAC